MILNSICTQKITIYRIKSFHFYKQKNKNTSRIGCITKASIKKQYTHPDNKKKKLTTAVIVRTKQFTRRGDGSYRKFNNNASIIIKKNMQLVSNKIIGPTLLELGRKKYINSFKIVY